MNSTEVIGGLVTDYEDHFADQHENDLQDVTFAGDLYTEEVLESLHELSLHEASFDQQCIRDFHKSDTSPSKVLESGFQVSNSPKVASTKLANQDYINQNDQSVTQDHQNDSIDAFSDNALNGSKSTLTTPKASPKSSSNTNLENESPLQVSTPNSSPTMLSGPNILENETLALSSQSPEVTDIQILQNQSSPSRLRNVSNSLITKPMDTPSKFNPSQGELNANEDKATFQTRNMNEFDPLIPKDWMMSFDSPNAQRAIHKSPRPLRSISQTPNRQSLLDSIEPMASPRSILKYNEHQLEIVRKEMQCGFDKEFGIAQVEISELSSRVKDLEEENRRVKLTLGDWERAVGKMIGR